MLLDKNFSNTFRKNVVLIFAVAVIIVVPLVYFFMISGNESNLSTSKVSYSDRDIRDKSVQQAQNKTENEQGEGGLVSPSSGNGQVLLNSGDLGGNFPDKLEGYKVISESPGKIEASRTYEANAKANPRVKLLTIMFHQTNSENAAKTWIDINVKSSYNSDAKNINLSGIPAYFGTDGNVYAVLAYQKNGVVCAIEMLSSGGSPKEFYEDIVELSARIP